MVDYDLFSEKLTWLIRQIEGANVNDAINIVDINEAIFLQTIQVAPREFESFKIKIKFENVNDLLEKIICQIEKTRKY